LRGILSVSQDCWPSFAARSKPFAAVRYDGTSRAIIFCGIRHRSA
jgi:hypothetical protein